MKKFIIDTRKPPVAIDRHKDKNRFFTLNWKAEKNEPIISQEKRGVVVKKMSFCGFREPTDKYINVSEVWSDKVYFETRSNEKDQVYIMSPEKYKFKEGHLYEMFKKIRLKLMFS